MHVPDSWWANAMVLSSSHCLWASSHCYPERPDVCQVVISDKTQMGSHFSSLTLIITMWDSSRISRKWGFSTDKLMLGTGRTHKRNYGMLVRAPTRTWQCKDSIYYTFGIEMIFDVPLRAWSVLHVGTAGHLHLFPAPEQKQNLHFLTVWRKNKTKQKNNLKKMRVVLNQSGEKSSFTTSGGFCQRSKARNR